MGESQGQAARAARGRLRLTQSMLATAAGVSRSTVQRLEADLPVADESMRAVCAVLGTDASAMPRPATAPPPAPAARDTGAARPDRGPASGPPSASDPGRARWPLVEAYGLLLPFIGLLVLQGAFDASPRDTVGFRSQATYYGLVAAGCAMLSGATWWRACRLLGLRDAGRRWWVGCTLFLLALPAIVLAGEGFEPTGGPVSLTMYHPRPGGQRDPIPTWRVADGSPTQAAGLRVGDLVRRLDGVDVTDAVTFALTAMQAADRVVDLEVCRAAALRDCVGGKAPTETLHVRGVAAGPCLDTACSSGRNGTLGDMSGSFAPQPSPPTWTRVARDMRRPLALLAGVLSGADVDPARDPALWNRSRSSDHYALRFALDDAYAALDRTRDALALALLAAWLAGVPWKRAASGIGGTGRRLARRVAHRLRRGARDGMAGTGARHPALMPGSI